jgi:addiction module HigA family antidote
MTAMFNPPHPGCILRDDVLPALGLNVTEAAGQLGVSRVTLSRITNGQAKIGAEMALRLEQWIGPAGGSADMWLRMQAAYDLWHTRKSSAATIRKIKKARPIVNGRS